MNDPRGSIFIRIIRWFLALFSQSEPGDQIRPGHGRNEGVHPEPNRLQAQVQVVRDAFGPSVGISWDGSGDSFEFLYRVDHVLVPTDRVAELNEYFRAQAEDRETRGEALEEPVDGLTLYALPSAYNDSAHPLPSLLEQIESALGPGVVTPDHVIYVTTHSGGICPATEPEHTDRDLPWPRESRDTDRGSGVMINVVDTGWWKPAAQDPDAPWLAHGVDGDAEQINPAAIHPYGGHGTFVAGVIRCQAPQAEVHIDGMLTKGGAIFESELMKQLDVAVLSNTPNIVSISGGTHTYGDRPLLTFEHLAQKHNLIGNPQAPLIVAAAGNDGANSPFWPAAYDWVVGVGSLDPDDTVSDYSNYGDWVDIFALGRDHVNAFPTGTYTCYEPPNVGEVRQFKNLAKWSGTSFSTPLITGMIAGLMTDHGLTAREAWLRLKADGIVRTDPKIGKILTVDTPGD